MGEGETCDFPTQASVGKSVGRCGNGGNVRRRARLVQHGVPVHSNHATQTQLTHAQLTHARPNSTLFTFNFSSVYLTLLHSIDPSKCPLPAELAAADAEPLARAHAVVENARALDVPVMVQPADIVSGNRKLNLAFVAQIFNTRHGLEVRAEERKEIEQAFEAVALTEEPEEDAREERVFRMWLNSLGLNDGATVIRSLSDDLDDGATLIDAIVAVAGDTVSLGARKVNRGDKLNQFKRVRVCAEGGGGGGGPVAT